MGKKVTRSATHRELIANELLKQLASLGDVTQKKMFGGVGIFCDKKMFALVNSAGTSYLKTDQQSAKKFEELDCEKFGNMPYHEIPESVLASSQELLNWAKTAVKLAKQRP